MRRGRALALLGIGLYGGLAGVPSIASAIDQESAEPEVVVEDRLTITDTRLTADPAPALRAPTHATVIDAERIERSGVRTLQDLLALEAGVVLYDQTGNDVAKTLDLRGFADGTGTRVYLDGAPLNHSRNNALALELVPLTALERVEITRGPTAALGGAGAEAGIIQLFSRRGEPFGGRISAALGDFGTTELRGDLHHARGRLDLALAGSWYETDGFRDNTDGDLGRFGLTAGWDLGADRRLSFSWFRGRSDFGTPGALTLEESGEDPSQAPFNLLDFADEGQTQGSLGFQGPIGGPFSLAANLFYRERDSEVLSTGRAAPAFGGFFLDSGERAVGSTVQLAHRHVSGALRNDLHVGVEWLDGETDSTGFFTTAGTPGEWDPGSPSSDNTAERTTTAVFAQDTLELSADWAVSLSARWDRDEVGYREARPNPQRVDSRRYSELSTRAGLTWTPRPDRALWISWGEAYLPPTVEQLFSFPLFGSNPDLQAEDSEALEIGLRRRWGESAELDLALFRTDTSNEIVFDPDSPLGLFGANVNAGETRRQGLEASFRGQVLPKLALFADLTWMSAEFRAGENRGNRVPLVPERRLSAGFDLDLPAALRLRFEGLHVGDQVLDNDEANSQATLDPYTVFNGRIVWALGEVTPAAGGVELFFEARNLFDEQYATRGIYAFDFSSFTDEVFVTPAPGRRLLGGAQWRF
jgi:iron complex outermembrane receptor protein